MTISEYYDRVLKIYKGEAVVYFLASGCCFGLLLFLTKGNYLVSGLGIIPFFILGCVSLNRFGMLFLKKGELRETEERRRTSPLGETQLFIAFLPSPTLHLLFFTGDGVYAGSLKDKRSNIWMWIIPASLLLFMPRRYLLVDNEGNPVAEYKVKHGMNGSISIMDANRQEIGVYKQEMRLSGVMNEYGIRQYEGKMEHAAAFKVVQAINKRPFAECNSGWMPAYASGRFLDANMPVLTFTEATENEKRIAFSYCVDYLQGQNH
ncbi:hypothetical protein CYL18_03920 [Pradoshia eiseniae]|uniref:Uncharacterized protein n=1 Tax=Pradoshia eiseniae TaxID=2064768 RepID=A0A2S7N4M8_9BACI|nr:hypothetical protein [Pradoshia eiseniae]PQD97031.1 hypothetical protein CYL18_03920 [Pradoshia eiseniae]